MMGLPMDNWRIYADAVHSLAFTPSGTPEYKQVEIGFGMMLKEVMELIPVRRENPKGDLVSFLTQLRIDGEPINDADVLATCAAMIAGGMDTTTALFAQAFEYLDRDRAARRRLIEEPEMVPKAGEEFLRYYTPVVCVGRTAMEDTEINGFPVSQGERVLISWAAANLDPKVFPDPLTIDFDRDTRKSAAFGIGMHRCLGRHIAMTDFEVVVNEVLSRLPDYELIEGQAERYRTVGQINGYVKMPARFTPGKRIGPDVATAGELLPELRLDL
jgi:cytochrome P450